MATITYNSGASGTGTEALSIDWGPNPERTQRTRTYTIDGGKNSLVVTQAAANQLFISGGTTREIASSEEAQIIEFTGTTNAKVLKYSASNNNVTVSVVELSDTSTQNSVGTAWTSVSNPAKGTSHFGFKVSVTIPANFSGTRSVTVFANDTESDSGQLSEIFTVSASVSLIHRAISNTHITAAQYGSGETITFEGEANGQYIKFSSGTISAFNGFSFQENSTGEYVSRTPGNTWIAVGNPGGTYHYKVICPVPVDYGSGASAAITIYVSNSNEVSASSIDVEYELTNAVAPPAVTTANIYAVYKSPNVGGGEQVNGKIGWYIDNVSDDLSYPSIRNTSDSSYAYSLMKTLSGNTSNVIKFGMSASAIGVIMQSPFNVYASSTDVTTAYITDGTFISNSNKVGTLENNSSNDSSLMLTIPFSSIWTQLSLEEGDEINLYVLIGADIEHGPSVDMSNTTAEIEYNDNTDTYGDEIGFVAMINGAARQSTYTITAGLYLIPNSEAVNKFKLVDNGNGAGVIYYNNSATIAANGGFPINKSLSDSKGVEPRDYIKIKDNSSSDPEATIDASNTEILEMMYTYVSMIKVRLTIHDNNNVYSDVTADIDFYRQHY